MKLSQFQQCMTNEVFHKEKKPELNDYLKSYGPRELEERLAIYQNNTFQSLIEVIKDLYPTIELTIGDDLLSACARAFIEKNPPTSPIMQEYALDFPAFLLDLPPVQSTPYLCDLAKIDLLQHQSYHSADEDSLAAEAFTAIDINTLAASRINPISSAFLLKSPFAVFDMWQLANGECHDEVNANSPQNVLIIRVEMLVKVYEVNNGIFTFLDALAKNATVYDALECATEQASDFNPTQAISFLIQSGFTANILGE